MSINPLHHQLISSLAPLRYDPDADKWEGVAPMSMRRIGVGVAVVNRLLYAVGGFDGSERLSSVECFYPEKDEWKQVAPMHKTRSGAGERSSQQKSLLQNKLIHILKYGCLWFESGVSHIVTESL